MIDPVIMLDNVCESVLGIWKLDVALVMKVDEDGRLNAELLKVVMVRLEEM